MTDEPDLTRRLRSLADSTARTPAPGLADVRRRRDRRRRNLAAATALGVVALLGGGALALQPLGRGDQGLPAGPGPTVGLTSPPAAGTATATGTEPSPTTTPTATSAEDSAPTTTESEPAAPQFALDLGSIVTADELRAAGLPLVGEQQGDADGQPTVPPLCTATSWQEQHSDPADRVSASYFIEGGQLVFDLFAYADATAANAALVRLKDDARACPVVNEFLAIEVPAVGVAVGEEFVDFALDAESGRDGSVERIWVTIARIGNVLVATTLDRDPGFAGDVSGDQQLARDAAQANVDHLLATG